MIGQNQIIAFRKQGMKPAAIFIEAGFQPLPTRFPFEDPEQAIAHKLYPVVTIRPDELTQRHDFRFCVGCSVHVHGYQMTDEVLSIGEKVAEAGAARVIVAAIENNEILQFAQGEWQAYADAS